MIDVDVQICNVLKKLALGLQLSHHTITSQLISVFGFCLSGWRSEKSMRICRLQGLGGCKNKWIQACSKATNDFWNPSHGTWAKWPKTTPSAWLTVGAWLTVAACTFLTLNYYYYYKELIIGQLSCAWGRHAICLALCYCRKLAIIKAVCKHLKLNVLTVLTSEPWGLHVIIISVRVKEQRAFLSFLWWQIKHVLVTWTNNKDLIHQYPLNYFLQFFLKLYLRNFLRRLLSDSWLCS